MLKRDEDTIVLFRELNGVDHQFEIAYTMNDDLVGAGDEPVSGVAFWRVYRIDGNHAVLPDRWERQLSDEDICGAIMEAQS